MSTLPNNTLAAKMADQIGFSNAALQKAAAFQDGVEKQAAACAALIPACVQALVDNERIEPGQAEKAAQMLKDPVKVLEILTKVAKHRNHSEQGLGTPVDASNDKSASAGGSKLSPADQKFWADMGLNVPAE